MNELYERWFAGEISTADALAEIGNRLLMASDEDRKDLFDLSARILDAEMPMVETDAEADERWWNHHHPVEEA